MTENKAFKITVDDFIEIRTEIESLSIKRMLIPSFGFNLTLSPDSSTLYFCTQNGISIIDLKTLQVKKTQKITLTNSKSLCYSAKLSTLYLGDNKGFLHICSHDTLHISNKINLQIGSLTKLKLSKDESRLYASSGASNLIVLAIDSLEIQQLYTHDEDDIRSFDISPDELFIVSVGEKRVKFYSILEEKVLHTIEVGQCTVFSAKFSPDGRSFVTGDSRGNLRIYQINDFSFVEKTGYAKEIMYVLYGNGFIVSAGSDKIIRIWDTVRPVKPVEILINEAIITDILIDNDLLYILLPSSLAITRIPELSNDITLKFHEKPINKILYSSRHKLLITSTNTEQKIFLWDSSYKLQQAIQTEGHIKSMCLTSNQQFIFIAASFSIYKVYLENDIHAEVFSQSDSVIASIACTYDNNYVITIDSSCKCIVRNILDKSTVWVTNYHQLSGIAVGVTQLSNIMITVGTDHCVILYNLGQRKVLGRVQGIESEATKLSISSDDQFAAVSTISNKTHLISIEKQACIYTFAINKQKTFDNYFTQDNKNLLLLGFDSDGSELFFYSLKGFYLMMTLKFSGASMCLTLLNEEREIMAADGLEISIKENPLKRERFKLFTNSNIYPMDAYEYFSKIYNGIQTDYDQSMDKFVFLPSLINSIQVYAYYNLSSHLEKALANGAAPYLSRNNLDILSTSIQKGYYDSIKFILAHTADVLSKNPYAAIFIENALCDLNKESCQELEILYSKLFFKSTDPSLPRFAEVDYTIYKSDSFEIVPNKFLNTSGQGRPIEFYQSAIRISLEKGSQGSIDYLQSLIDTGNNEIFRSKFIETLLNAKWAEIKPVALFFAGFYLSYLIFLGLYILSPIEIYYWVLNVQNALLIIIELYQLWLGGFSYFLDVWNIVDVIRAVVFIVYFSLADHYQELLFLLTLASWGRGITHFRVFSITRYMVHLLIEVGKDIFAFFIILFYFTLAFTFMLISTQDPIPDYSNLSYIEKTYLLTFGSFEMSDSNNVLEWICFVISSLINFLVMINLLISIIADTYDKVLAYRDIADRKEMSEMIMEIEKLFIWKRGDQQKKYLQLVCSDFLMNHEDAWQGKIRELQLSIEKVNENLMVTKAEFNEKFKEVLDMKDDLKAVRAAVEKMAAAKT